MKNCCDLTKLFWWSSKGKVIYTPDKTSELIHEWLEFSYSFFKHVKSL